MRPISFTAINKQHWLAYVLFFAVAFGACLGFLWKNDFPYYYHPDEPTKVAQVESNLPNFKHPLLLINGTRLILAASPHQPPSKTQIVTAGRSMNAVLLAMAIFLLMCLAYQQYGLVCGLSAGLMMTFSTELLHCAHTMKEDAWLIFGIALIFCAARVLLQSPRQATFTLFAVSTAIVGGSKYTGLLFLPLSLWLVQHIKSTHPHFPLQIGKRVFSPTTYFLMVFGGVFTLINYQAFLHFITFINGFYFEARHAFTSHHGIVQHDTYLYYYKQFAKQVPRLFQWGMALFVLQNLLQFYKMDWAKRFEVGFLLSYILVLSVAKIAMERYYYPIEVLTYYFVPVAFCAWLRWVLQLPLLRNRVSRFKPIFISLLLVWVTVIGVKTIFPSYLTGLTSYSYNTRKDLVTWFHHFAQPPFKVAQDKKVRLVLTEGEFFKNTPRMLTTQNVLSKDFVGDFRTLEALRQQNVKYVVLLNNQYKRFFDPMKQPTKEGMGEYRRRKVFYTQLCKEGKLLWQSRSGASVLQPSLWVYQIQ